MGLFLLHLLFSFLLQLGPDRETILGSQLDIAPHLAHFQGYLVAHRDGDLLLVLLVGMLLRLLVVVVMVVMFVMRLVVLPVWPLSMLLDFIG